MTGYTLPKDTVALCQGTLSAHSKSFSLASRLLPPREREQAAVVYTFCRRADDAIDLTPPGEQRQSLTRLREELNAVFTPSAPTEPVLAAFRQVVEERRIPRSYPSALLDGMEMDVANVRYGTMQTLLTYCFRVAGTVGLMMSHVMGLSDDRALKSAADLGIAMQLTNICRDVLEDWKRGRLYLPDALLSACGAPGLVAHLGGAFPEHARAPVARVVAELLRVAEAYYRSGEKGLSALSWRCALAVRAAREIYAEIGQRIAGRGYDVFTGRAVVPPREKARLLLRASLMTAKDLPRRLALPKTLRPRIPERELVWDLEKGFSSLQ